MGWLFIADIAFFGLLGVLAFVPIVALVASIEQKSFASARSSVKKFLESWAAIGGEGFAEKVLKVAGVSTVVVILALSSYVFNRLGDATLPEIANVTTYYGMSRLQWSAEHKHDWKQVKSNLRVVTGIEGDRDKWEEVKAAAGSYDTRLFRTIFWLFAFLFVAGVIDLVFWKSHKSRGAFLLMAAIVGLLLSQWLWSERQDNYIENILWRYHSVYCSISGAKALPESLPEKWECARPPLPLPKAIADFPPRGR